MLILFFEVVVVRKEDVMKLEDVERLIWKEVFGVLRGFNDVMYDKNDLFQEAALVFLLVKDKWDREKSSFVTFFVHCLRNHFRTLFVKSKKFVWESDLDNICTDDDLDTRVEVSLKMEKDKEFLEKVRCLVGLNEEFNRWKDKREWARKNLGMRFTKDEMKEIEQFFVERR